MDLQYNTEAEYQALCLEKALNLYGQLIVSAGLEANISPDEIGQRFLGVVANDEERLDFKAYYGRMMREGKPLK